MASTNGSSGCIIWLDSSGQQWLPAHHLVVVEYHVDLWCSSRWLVIVFVAVLACNTQQNTMSFCVVPAGGVS
jgi:hypothetical protein